MLTVVLEGSKNNWTKGSIYNIFQDAETYIKDEAILKFGDLHNLVLKYMETQTFTLRNIDDFQYVTHGDFSFEDK